MYQHQDWVSEFDLTKIKGEEQCKFLFESIVGQDARFQYFKKENEGLSLARNFGIDHSKGDWLIIVDSDDALTEDHVEKLMQPVLDNPDKPVVPYFICDHCYNSDFKIITSYKPNKINAANSFVYPVLIAWNYAADLNFIRNHNLYFEPRLGPGPARDDKVTKHGYEDTFFASVYLEALEAAYGKKSILYVNTGQDTYLYRDVNLAGKGNLNVGIWADNYRKFTTDHLAKSKLTSLRGLAPIYNYWSTLWEAKNPVKKFIKNLLTLYIRFSTR